jgi:hypothetical protein
MNVLSVIGCSGSLALAAVFASPASASSIAQLEVNQIQGEVASMAITQAQGDILRDALGCGCATCQASQPQPML